MPDTIFMAVPRPGGQELRLALSSYEGRQFANLRVWFNAGGEMRPGPKGVTVPLWALGRLREALAELEAHARAEGLIAPPKPTQPWTVQ
jgi:hypothetical protein